MTRLKQFFINAVIVLGALVIVYVQWPEALKNSGFGSGGYNQGMIGTVLLAILMAGIPIIIFAIVAHLALAWLLFRPGELEEYKARKLVESLSAKSPRTPKPSPDSQASDNSLN
jgi:hypothetical protein